jgi:hypothetical protein
MARVGATRSKSSRRGRAAKRPVRAASPTTKPAAEPVTPPAAAPREARAGSFPNSWQLLAGTWRFWRSNARVLSIYLLVVAVLSLFLVHNFGADATQLKSQVSDLLGGNASINNLATYAAFVSSSTGSAQGAASVYQYVLLVIVSLSTVWLLRQLLSDKPPAKLRVRDSFYQGMYPLVPFVLVLVVLTLLLVPLALGAFIYSTVVQNGVAVGVLQDFLWLLVLVLGAVISFWLLATYYFAVYIVTLPNMTPIPALRNARQLSRGQRPNIIRKALILALVCLLVSMIVLLPTIAIVPSLSGLMFFILSVIALPFIHSYMYVMYRELLHE